MKTTITLNHVLKVHVTKITDDQENYINYFPESFDLFSVSIYRASTKELEVFEISLNKLQSVINIFTIERNIDFLIHYASRHETNLSNAEK